MNLMIGRPLFCLLLTALIQREGRGEPNPDWPGWRGPTHDGIAAPGQNPPVEWSETRGVVWKVELPGRGHGSPTVVGDRIYLPTADMARGSQSILCLDRASGKIVWEKAVHKTGAEAGHHQNSSAASSTITFDQDRLFVTFLNSGAVYASAFSLEGKLLWQQKVCDYQVHQGFAASPVVYKSVVIVAADHRGGGTLAGLDRETGRVIWSQLRPKTPNYTTPAVVQAAGKTQLVLGGCTVVASFDPGTGRKLWESSNSTEECVTTAVTDGKRVFTSGGYPRNHVVAIEADGSSKIAWQNNVRVYVPSMIAKAGYLYAVTDAGMAICWKSDTGEELWKERLGGDFFASPVMVNDRIYASNLRGQTFVFEATPQRFKLLAQNQLADQAYASPAICGGRIYLRVAKNDGGRKEYLYCLGEKD